MKRSKSSTRAMRQRTTAEIHSKGTSRYAQKVRENRQMYASKHDALQVKG